MFDDKQWNQYLSALSKRESGDNPHAINQFGYLGLFQMGAMALEDAGYVKKGVGKKGNKALRDPSNWTTKDGAKGFLNNKEEQVKAIKNFTQQNYNRMVKLGLLSEDATPDEVAGMLFVSHLKGIGGAKDLKNGKVTADGNGTTTASYYRLGKKALQGREEKFVKTQSIIGSQDMADVPEFKDVFPRRADRESTATFSEGFGGGFRRENTIYQAATRYGSGLNKGEIDPNFNPADHITDDMVEFWDFLKDSPNKQDFEENLRWIDKRRKDAELQAEGGIGSILGSIAGSVVSPITIIPGIGWGSKAVQGASLASRIGMGVGVGGSLLASEEAILHQTDPTRTMAESAVNASIGAAMGGLLLGAGVRPGMRVASKEGRELLSKELSGDINVRLDAAENIESTVGAKSAAPTVSSEGLAESNSIFNATLTLSKKLSPKLRMMTSSSPQALRLANKMIVHDFKLGKNLEGIASDVSIESITTAKLGRLRGKIVSMEENFSALKKEDFSMNRKAFDDEVLDSFYKDAPSKNKRVSSAVDNFKSYFDDALERLKAKNLIDESVENSKILTQVFKHEAIWARRGEYLDLIRKAIKKQFPNISSQAALQGAAEIANKPVKSRVMDLDYLKFKKTDELAGKSLLIDEVEFKDFLVRDPKEIMQRQGRQIETKLAYDEAFEGKSFKEMLEDVEIDFDNKIEGASTLKKQKQLIREKSEAIRDLKATDDILMGRYKLPEDPYGLTEPLVEGALAMSYVTTGGGILLASIPDLGSLLKVTKLGKVIGADAVEAGKVLKGMKLSKADMKDLGIGLESYLSSRALDLADFYDSVPLNKWSPMFREAAGKFGNLSGSNYWNDFVRRYATKHVADNAIRDLQKWVGGTLKQDKIEAFLQRGIHIQNAQQILEEFGKHSAKADGVTFPNLSKWGPNGDKFKQFVINEVNSTVLIPSATDRSLWMKTGIGRVLSQYSGFAMAFTNKILLPGLQNPDKIFLSRISSMIFLASQVHNVRRLIAGKDIEDDPAKLLSAGIERSGVLGIMYDIHNRIESFTGLGVNTALGLGKSSKYAGRAKWGVLLGPSAGLVENMVKGMDSIMDGTITPREARTLKRLVPGQNLFYLQYLTDQLAQEAAR